MPNQSSFRIRHLEVPSFRKAEVCSLAFPATVQLLAFLKSLCDWPGRSLQHRQLCPIFCRQSSKKTSWARGSVLRRPFRRPHGWPLCRPCGWLTFRTSAPILNAQLRTSCMIWLFLPCVSVQHVCQFPSVFDPFSAAIFSQSKSSQQRTGIQGGHLPLPPPPQP